MEMVDWFYAESRKGATPYNKDSRLEIGDTISLLGKLNVIITAPVGGMVPLGKAIGTDLPIVTRVPFHLGYVSGTTGLCNVVIKAGEDVFEEDSVIVLDKPTSYNTVEHYLLIGYELLEDAQESLLDTLGLDTKTCNIRKYRTTLNNVVKWITDYKENHDKPFSGEVAVDEGIHLGVPCEKGSVPISYSFLDGRKVYKACVVGAIESMNDDWRVLCDTITFLEKDEIIIVYISSGGGDTQTASSFIAATSLCRGTVVTVACGSCASAAPVIWSVGDIRLVTSAAAMMVHSMAISDPSVKATSHIVDLGKFATVVTKKFLKDTVGKVGLATDDEINTVVGTAREYWHDVKTVVSRTGAKMISTDRDLWDAIKEDGK